MYSYANFFTKSRNNNSEPEKNNYDLKFMEKKIELLHNQVATLNDELTTLINATYCTCPKCNGKLWINRYTGNPIDDYLDVKIENYPLFSKEDFIPPYIKCDFCLGRGIILKEEIPVEISEIVRKRIKK